MWSSIRVRLMCSHLAAIILAMGLSGFLLLSFLERYFLQATEDSLIAQARITAGALIPGAMADGPPVEDEAPPYNTIQQQQLRNLYVQAENIALPDEQLALDNANLSYLDNASLQLGAQLETRIRILDANGVVLVDSHQPESGESLQSDSLVAQALAGNYASRTTETGQGDVMMLALPARVEDQLIGVVVLSQPLDDVTAVLHDLRMWWGLSTAIALVLSGAVGLLLSQAITRPLRRLTAAAGAVAQGNFDQQVSARSKDEIGQLGRTFNDMTTRLQAARQMQVDFVANVSHELRTPLTAVKGMVETLRAGAVNDPGVRDSFLATVENETDRLIRLVHDLLTLSRADSAALNLRRAPVDLAMLVTATADRLIPQAERRDLVLRVEAASRAPCAWADSDRVAQVLTNLLDNALKYSRPGGLVTVRVDTGPDHDTLIQVRDEGIGIADDDLPRIGERFYRADKARSRAQGGSGLGLAIAQALVNAHGGHLWLESQEGVGTVASFTLPAA
ncbi:MAG: HAMP domain-containing protein [Anaerolineae bacterium]|nr:HAMP domain-containing protein [Anaerolineae bacterium]